jgi:deazaflavin-dependent oxidoreductase (nitroreductase family)
MSVANPSKPTPRTPPKILNQIMSLVLRFPGPLSKQLTLLTFTGRKSGKTFTTPLGFTRRGDTVILFTDHAWWKNLRNNPSVTLHLQGKKVKGNAEVIHDDREKITQELLDFVRQRPNGARAYHVTLDASGQPTLESAQQAAQWFALIYIHLVPKNA